MVVHLDREHGVAMHAMTPASVEIINDALTLELLLFSPDGEPLSFEFQFPPVNTRGASVAPAKSASPGARGG